LLFAWLLADFSVSAQTPDTSLVIGETVQLESQVLNETRRLIIGKPSSYETSDDNYPVLFLLDGSGNFEHTTSTAKFLARNGRIPEMLVVGITNADRNRDLSPPTQQPEDSERYSQVGGADNFLRFISEELIPWVDENYRTLPHRVLVGHSIGGLFAIHTLFSGSTVAYIVISPSMWWNDQRLVTEAEAFFEHTPKLNERLFMTAGNEGGALLGATRKLAGVLDEFAPRGFEWQFVWMPDESHGSVPFLSTYQGLQFIFPDYYLADAMKLFDAQGLDGIKDFFARSGERLGVERKIPLSSLGTVLNGLISAERWDEMATLMEQGSGTFSPPIDEELYSQAWTYLARGYATKNNEKRAIEFYRKLVAADPENESAVKALRDLRVSSVE
jgi:predicted alpha/beta superfamily hydrolase